VVALYTAAWGSTYVWTSIALRDFEPAGLVLARLLLAAAVLLAGILAFGSPATRRAVVAALRRPREALRLGLCAYGVPYLLITLAQERVPAGLTGVLIASLPLWTAALAPWLDRAERAGARQVGALVVGLGGVALIVGVDLATTVPELIAAAAILAATFFFALGGFMISRDLVDLPVLVRATVSLWLAALLLVPLGIVELLAARPSAGALGALAAVAVVSTALGASIQVWLTQRIGPARAALAAYIAPVFALLFAALMLHEPIPPVAVVGLALIVGAVAVAGRRSPLDPGCNGDGNVGVGTCCAEPCGPQRSTA